MKFLLILIVFAALSASSSAIKDEICSLPHSQRGLCRAAIRSWSYDAANRVCTRFLYGGCGAMKIVLDPNVNVRQHVWSKPEPYGVKFEQ